MGGTGDTEHTGQAAQSSSNFQSQGQQTELQGGSYSEAVGEVIFLPTGSDYVHRGIKYLLDFAR